MNHHSPLRTLVGNVTLGVSVLCLFSSAWAKHPGAEFPISIAEVQSRADSRFAATDADNDGTISREEFAAADWPHRHPAHGGAGHQRMAKEFPHDADAQLRREALEKHLFAMLDKDDDGMLSPAEFSARNMPGAGSPLKRQWAFDHLDADDNGSLSRDELPDPASRLRTLDADGDGMVSREEALAHRRSGGQSDG